MSRVFLSHNHQDKSFARKLSKDLVKKDIKVWLDEAELQVGDSLIKKIESAIAEVDYLIAVLSTNSVISEWVNRELEIAITKEIHNKRLFVLPVIIDDCDIPSFLSGRIYLNFNDPEKYQDNVDKILQRLGASQAQPPAPTAKGKSRPFAIPVHSLNSETEYRYIGSVPSPEDAIYVNMIYLTVSNVVVDLLIPPSVYDAYNLDIFKKHVEEKNIESGQYSDDGLGWIEISIPRKEISPEDVERLSLQYIGLHNEELRWLLYFSST